MINKIPNILTIGRILIIPLIILSFYMFQDSKYAHIFSAALFVLACVTDFLDGYIARSFKLQSNFGKLFDPIADKLLVSAAILILVHHGKAAIMPSLAIICREILVSGLREFLAEIRISVPVSKLSKIKTFLQMLAIFLLLLGSKGSGIKYLDLIGNVFLWTAAILTIITGYIYLKEGLRYIAHDNKEENDK